MSHECEGKPNCKRILKIKKKMGVLIEHYLRVGILFDV